MYTPHLTRKPDTLGVLLAVHHPPGAEADHALPVSRATLHLAQNRFVEHVYSDGSLHLLPVLELGRHLPPVLDVVHHAGRQDRGRHHEHQHDQEDDQSPPSDQAANLKLLCVI